MGALVVVDKLTVSAGSATLVDALSFTIRPGEVLALDRRIRLGQDHHGAGADGPRAPRLPHQRRQRAHRRRGRALAGLRDSCAPCADAPCPTSRRARRRRSTLRARILDQVVEPAVVHGTLPRGEAELKAIALFRELALPEPETIGQRYPHQVSGGQLQRLMAAMALITDPEVVILDEPTTALDVTTQVEVLRAFRRVVRERQVTAVYVSHDLAVVAQMADHILVLRDGRMREVGTTERLLAAPQNEYTQSLLAAARPAPRTAGTAGAGAEVLLRVKGLSAGYGPRGRDGKPAVTILEDIDLELKRGQAIGVIGESGSGKTTLARVVAGLLPPSAGTMEFDGRVLPPALKARSRDDLRRIQIVFQSADTALNPSRTIEAILARPLQFYRGLKGEPLRRRIDELLDLVKLPRTLAGRLPGGLSGGQKQRVNLARALAADPDLILCDEVTSALDTVVGAAVLDLIAELRRELGVSYLFISHDLHTVRAVCDEIVVMRHGRKLAQVARADYERGPHHPYYEELARAVPELRRGWLDELDRARPALVA